MERETEQALFAARHDPRLDVEEDGGGGGSRLEHLHDAHLLQDEEPIRAVTRVSDEERTREACRHDRAELDGAGAEWREHEQHGAQRGCAAQSEHRLLLSLDGRLDGGRCGDGGVSHRQAAVSSSRYNLGRFFQSPFPAARDRTWSSSTRLVWGESLRETVGRGGLAGGRRRGTALGGVRARRRDDTMPDHRHRDGYD
jgi:hypothetical protein